MERQIVFSESLSNLPFFTDDTSDPEFKKHKKTFLDRFLSVINPQSRGLMNNSAGSPINSGPLESVNSRDSNYEGYYQRMRRRRDPFLLSFEM